MSAETAPSESLRDAAPHERDARPATPRAQAREHTMTRILELGNAQLVEHGAADLSVREIARGLGMVSSAIYRYVGSRDALLTLLIVDAYRDLADAVDEAVAAAGEEPRERFLALAGAMKRWAVVQPERWTLLYGTPVRGYAAPAETTNQAGTRVAGRVLEIAADASQRRQQTAPRDEHPLAPEIVALLEDNLAGFGIGTDPDTAFRAVTAWSSLIGVLSAHVFEQLGPDAVAVGEQVLDVQFQYLADLIATR